MEENIGLHLTNSHYWHTSPWWKRALNNKEEERKEVRWVESLYYVFCSYTPK